MKKKNICGHVPNVKQELTTRAVATIITEADLRITAEACQDYINK